MHRHSELVWRPSYSVGNEVIDAQHKKLQWLCHAAAYYLGNPSNDEAERYKDVLHDLGVFAREHFATEEQILAEAGYPLLKQHQIEHEAYRARLATVINDAQNGRIEVEALASWLDTWWLHHTLGSDQKYVGHLTDS